MEMVDKVLMLRMTMIIKPKEGKVCFFMFFSGNLYDFYVLYPLDVFMYSHQATCFCSPFPTLAHVANMAKGP